MNLWEWLDRRDARRMARQRRPIDTRMFVGLAFLAGYYWMVYRFISTVIPRENVPLVRDAMLVLGPAVGLIVGALFRTDVRDEIAAQNTGEGFRAMAASARATEAAAQSGNTGPTGNPGDPVHTVEENK